MYARVDFSPQSYALSFWWVPVSPCARVFVVTEESWVASLQGRHFDCGRGGGSGDGDELTAKSARYSQNGRHIRFCLENHSRTVVRCGRSMASAEVSTHQ
jgi:hypothetical protein